MPDGIEDRLAVGKRSLRHRGGCRSPCKKTSVFHSSWAHLDSNQGPAGYEPDALTAELWTQTPPGNGALKYIAPNLAMNSAEIRVSAGLGVESFVSVFEE